MEKLTKLKSFMFDKAQYGIVDLEGNKGILFVDYKNNSYEIQGNIMEISRLELDAFVETILKRKHGVNFVS
jgi:hypothetical protein